jgi:hypothetical protein
MTTGSDPDRALEENIGIMAKPIIRRYNSPAGGWGALEATGKALADQGIALSGSATLLKMNQPEGFDCPGCAWPDPKHTSAFEFYENGAKAVAWEATAKRCTPEFFAAHALEVLRKKSDFELEMEVRLTHSTAYDHTSDKYVPVSWADALGRIGATLPPCASRASGDFNYRLSCENLFSIQLIEPLAVASSVPANVPQGFD